MVTPSALVETQRPEWRNMGRTHQPMEICYNCLRVFVTHYESEIYDATDGPVYLQETIVAETLHLYVHSIRCPEIAYVVVS